MEKELQEQLSKLTQLTNENYFSHEARMDYMGSSQFKSFMKCPACEVAKINGEIVEEKTTALMVGSYIDAYFSKEMDDFKAKNPEIYKRDGTLKSEYQQAEDIINFIEKDELFMKYLNGDHQTIMTGIIAGVPFKIKIDSYHPNKLIVDQKVMKDLEPIWNEDLHCKQNVVNYWGYDIQGAIYQEVVRQNTGLKLPFVLAIATKEKVPNKALLQIDQEDLDAALELVKANAPMFNDMKHGLIEPSSCGHCDYCKSKAMVTGIFSYHKIDPYREED